MRSFACRWVRPHRNPKQLADQKRPIRFFIGEGVSQGSVLEISELILGRPSTFDHGLCEAAIYFGEILDQAKTALQILGNCTSYTRKIHALEWVESDRLQLSVGRSK
jgi:hypothetical protein